MVDKGGEGASVLICKGFENDSGYNRVLKMRYDCHKLDLVKGIRKAN